MLTICPESGPSRGRRKKALYAVKAAVLTPIPIANAKNGDRRESGVATQNAGSVAQILENGLRQDHQIDFAHPLLPQTRVAKAKQRVAPRLFGRHAGGQVVFNSHLGVRAKFGFDFLPQPIPAEKI
jgi:hypothetical protein